MTDQAIQPTGDHLDIADVERRIKAIFIGSIGNLVEWYDFYAYTAFALYFAPAFFPNSDPVVQQLNVAVLFAATFTAVLATALAFGVQTVAQRFTHATHTALIFAAEPVFAGLFSFLLIGELLSPRQLAGCGLILAGMLVSELRRG